METKSLHKHVPEWKRRKKSIKKSLFNFSNEASLFSFLLPLIMESHELHETFLTDPMWKFYRRKSFYFIQKMSKIKFAHFSEAKLWKLLISYIVFIFIRAKNIWNIFPNFHSTWLSEIRKPSIMTNKLSDKWNVTLRQIWVECPVWNQFVWFSSKPIHFQLPWNDIVDLLLSKDHIEVSWKFLICCFIRRK